MRSLQNNPSEFEWLSWKLAASERRLMAMAG